MFRTAFLLIALITFALPVHAQGPDARQRDIVQAAAIYTMLSFSESNRKARRKNLPLSEAEYQKLDRLLPPRFQACMEGGFSVAFPQPEQARTIRLLMQSIINAEVAEPANAREVLSGFTRTNQWCAARIPLWTSAILN